MTQEQLKQFITQGENQTVEFKSSLKLMNEIGETISALANTSGGVILIGVSDDGNLLGVDIGKKTMEDLANFIKENTDPKIYPDIKPLKIDDKKIIAISLTETEEKPVFFKDRAFQRVGKTNQRISASKIRELAKQERIKLHWDEKICESSALEDIDEEKVKWFLQKARYERRLEINPNTSVKEALERLELTRNGRVTNAAVLLFGKNPQKFFLQVKLRCARYKGVTPITFIDLKVIEGNIIDQIEASEKFVLSHIKRAAKIVGFSREEAWEYPPSALREAIVNAVCHRDYSSTSDITIGILDSRIEISNPGRLPEPLTPALLKQKHKSIPRNPLIANACLCQRQTGLIFD
jgi:ATP-dependent DNA helicase RecG